MVPADDNTPLQLPSSTPPSAGKAWRDRLHTALDSHAALSPERMLDALAEQLAEDPIGVFRALSATLPKEVSIESRGQQHHLFLLKVVAEAHQQNLDLTAVADKMLDVSSETIDPEWLR